jgi:hypothetical protein
MTTTQNQLFVGIITDPDNKLANLVSGLHDCYFGNHTASLRKENYRVVNFQLLPEDGKLQTGEIYASKSGKDFYARLRLRGEGDSLFDIATGRKVEVNRLKMSFNNWGASDMGGCPNSR